MEDESPAPPVEVPKLKNLSIARPPSGSIKDGASRSGADGERGDGSAAAERASNAAAGEENEATAPPPDGDGGADEAGDSQTKKGSRWGSIKKRTVSATRAISSQIRIKGFALPEVWDVGASHYVKVKLALYKQSNPATPQAGLTPMMAASPMRQHSGFISGFDAANETSMMNDTSGNFQSGGDGTDGDEWKPQAVTLNSPLLPRAIGGSPARGPSGLRQTSYFNGNASGSFNYTTRQLTENPCFRENEKLFLQILTLPLFPDERHATYAVLMGHKVTDEAMSFRIIRDSENKKALFLPIAKFRDLVHQFNTIFPQQDGNLAIPPSAFNASTRTLDPPDLNASASFIPASPASPSAMKAAQEKLKPLTEAMRLNARQFLPDVVAEKRATLTERLRNFFQKQNDFESLARLDEIVSQDVDQLQDFTKQLLEHADTQSRARDRERQEAYISAVKQAAVVAEKKGRETDERVRELEQRIEFLQEHNKSLLASAAQPRGRRRGAHSSSDDDYSGSDASDDYSRSSSMVSATTIGERNAEDGAGTDRGPSEDRKPKKRRMSRRQKKREERQKELRTLHEMVARLQKEKDEAVGLHTSGQEILLRTVDKLMQEKDDVQTECDKQIRQQRTEVKTAVEQQTAAENELRRAQLAHRNLVDMLRITQQESIERVQKERDEIKDRSELVSSSVKGGHNIFVSMLEKERSNARLAQSHAARFLSLLEQRERDIQVVKVQLEAIVKKDAPRAASQDPAQKITLGTVPDDDEDNNTTTLNTSGDVSILLKKVQQAREEDGRVKDAVSERAAAAADVIAQLERENKDLVASHAALQETLNAGENGSETMSYDSTTLRIEQERNGVSPISRASRRSPAHRSLSASRLRISNDGSYPIAFGRGGVGQEHADDRRRSHRSSLSRPVSPTPGHILYQSEADKLLPHYYHNSKEAYEAYVSHAADQNGANRTSSAQGAAAEGRRALSTSGYSRGMSPGNQTDSSRRGMMTLSIQKGTGLSNHSTMMESSPLKRSTLHGSRNSRYHLPSTYDMPTTSAYQRARDRRREQSLDDADNHMLYQVESRHGAPQTQQGQPGRLAHHYPHAVPFTLSKAPERTHSRRSVRDSFSAHNSRSASGARYQSRQQPPLSSAPREAYDAPRARRASTHSQLPPSHQHAHSHYSAHSGRSSTPLQAHNVDGETARPHHIVPRQQHGAQPPPFSSSSAYSDDDNGSDSVRVNMRHTPETTSNSVAEWEYAAAAAGLRKPSRNARGSRPPTSPPRSLSPTQQDDLIQHTASLHLEVGSLKNVNKELQNRLEELELALLANPPPTF